MRTDQPSLADYGQTLPAEAAAVSEGTAAGSRGTHEHLLLRIVLSAARIPG